MAAAKHARILVYAENAWHSHFESGLRPEHLLSALHMHCRCIFSLLNNLFHRGLQLVTTCHNPVRKFGSADRVPWGGALLAMEPAVEELHPDVDQVILAGLAAQIGIAQDPINSLVPNVTTGTHVSSVISI